MLNLFRPQRDSARSKRGLLRAMFPVILLVLALAACGGSTQGSNTASGLSRTVDGIRVSVRLDPDPPSSSQDTKVEINLGDNAGNPIPDARVVVSLNPAAHGMTPVIAAAEPSGNGVYSTVLRPSGMVGEHNMNVDFQWNGRAYQATFKKLTVK